MLPKLALNLRTQVPSCLCLHSNCDDRCVPLYPAVTSPLLNLALVNYYNVFVNKIYKKSGQNMKLTP
jgi:hypothetical protein